MKYIKEPIRAFIICLTLLVSQSYAQTQTDTGKENEAFRRLEAGMEAGQYEVSAYNTACYFALGGKPGMAFTCLRQAIGEGFSDLGTLETDTDLSSLHNDPRWPGIVKGVKNNQTWGQDLFFNKNTFWDSKTFRTPYQQNISENEKIAGLSKFWSEVKYNFVNFDLVPAINFDSLYFAYLPKIRQSGSTLEYYMLLEELTAQLNDAHTNINFPRELTDSIYTRPLIRTRLVEDKVLIVDIYDPALRQKGIAIGQEVIQVNEVPVKDYAAKYIIPHQSSSTQQDRMVRAYDYALFRGSLTQPIKLQLRDASNKLSEHTLYRAKPQERSQKIQTRTFEYRMLPGNIAYVALNTFGNDSTAIQFAARFEEISKAKAIIFDVRNNGGGSTNPGWDILSYLIEKPTEVHQAYTRDYQPTRRAWGIKQKVTVSRSSIFPKRKFLYTKPVVVLTSARTFSAAEDFAAAFKTMNRGIILGEATGGSSGQPLFITLPGNGSARICTKRDKLGNGEDFVGKGIQPDKIVTPTIHDIRKGIDTELEAAIKELQKTGK